MTAVQKYILNETKVIEKECLEKGITAREWIDRYAEDYHRRYWNNNTQTINLGGENNRNKSHWAAGLERVNNI